MKHFNKIAATDSLFITQEGKHFLEKYSDKKVLHLKGLSLINKEIGTNLKEIDAILVSFQDKLTKKVLSQLPSLKYIGVGAKSIDNIDLVTAHSRGIVVSSVMRYGDEGPVEYIFSQLLNLARGFGKYQWKDMPAELFGKTIGIVGMGVIGKSVLRVALGFKMRVVYTSRTRKKEVESGQVKFLPLNKLISQSDVVSLHVPKNTQIFGDQEFSLMTPGKILVNTCLGKVFETEVFKKWIGQKNNYAIFDKSSSDEYFQELKGLPNVIFPSVIAGYTLEARERLTQGVVTNIESYLKDQ